MAYTPLSTANLSDSEINDLWNPKEKDWNSYVLVIENPHFGIADYSENVGHDVIQFMAEGYDQETEAPRKEKYSVGDGFAIQHNGRIILDPTDDKRGPTGGSNYGKWIKSAAENGIMTELRRCNPPRFDPRDAEIWRGMIVQLAPLKYKIKGGQERTMAVPVKFLGWAGEQKAPSTNGHAQAPAASSAPASASGGSADYSDASAAEMLSAAATAADYNAWRAACLQSENVKKEQAAIMAVMNPKTFESLKAQLGV